MKHKEHRPLAITCLRLMHNVGTIKAPGLLAPNLPNRVMPQESSCLIGLSIHPRNLN